MEAPGACSPSRKVVSKIVIVLGMSVCLLRVEREMRVLVPGLFASLRRRMAGTEPTSPLR
jgi:hypothetical protein